MSRCCTLHSFNLISGVWSISVRCTCAVSPQTRLQTSNLTQKHKHIISLCLRYIVYTCTACNILICNMLNDGKIFEENVLFVLFDTWCSQNILTFMCLPLHWIELQPFLLFYFQTMHLCKLHSHICTSILWYCMCEQSLHQHRLIHSYWVYVG